MLHYVMLCVRMCKHKYNEILKQSSTGNKVKKKCKNYKQAGPLTEKPKLESEIFYPKSISLT